MWVSSVSVEEELTESGVRSSPDGKKSDEKEEKRS